MQAEPLTLDAITVTANGTELFSNLSAIMRPGELWVIEGDSGRGKTALFKTLAGLLKPAAGRMLYGDTPLGACQGVVLFHGHTPALRREATVEQNLLYWATILNTRELVPTALHYYDLDSYADAPCAKLTAGWGARAALARLILNPAPLWLLDDPFIHLDAEGISLTQSLITTRLEQGGIVCISSQATLQGDRVKSINLNML